jgi:hypothetical protein
MTYPQEVTRLLHQIYEDLMWLASRPHVSPCRARAWYSQVFATALAPKVRHFTGRVSRKAALDPMGRLCLEHYDRLAFNLSRLIESDLANGIRDPDAFVALIQRCERVNITTDEENHIVQATGGDYEAARVELLDWADLSQDLRVTLWKRLLRRRVANAQDYALTIA